MAALGFMDELKDARLRLLEAPERWPPHLFGTRRVHFRLYPYSLIYRVLADRIEVLAVAHDRQRPGYWRSRPP